MSVKDDGPGNFRQNLIRYGGDLYPEIVDKAQGCYVWDSTGKKVLDFTSGQMCATVGHSHPNIVAAIKKSCDTALHLFSGMIPRSVVQLADALSKIVPKPLRKSLMLNTGSESNEAAIKMAKLYTGGFEVIGLGGSWHGVTGNAGSVSFASDRKGYGPGAPGIFVLPEPNAYRCPVKHCRDKCDRTCMTVGFELYDMQSVGAPAAVIAEPVISAGGVIVPPKGYFDALQSEARKRGMLLIFDEAQTAFGRLGHWFAASHLNVTPDIMTVSKTLGGGMPLAAVITNDEVEEVCHRRGFAFYTSHVSDPLPAAVGLAVLETIEREQLLKRSQEMGTYLAERLRELQNRHEEIGDVRGMGLLMGIELVKDRETREPHHELGSLTTQRCMELGLSMNIRRRPERGSVWRIAPPLTVTTADVDLAMTIFDQALSETRDVLVKRPAAARTPAQRAA
ncbi:MAG TPA: aspartate aminotransferase family protein [Casimicrobiaceae bacterium]|nr:aspartate aminotransferase family protein [Casimicrobiaceae bacterium]